MKVFDTHTDLQRAVDDAKSAGKRIGFVPTMGALHAGHLSLIHAARAHADFVVVSIFVNPTQFGAGEDFETYPRNTKRDVSILDGAGADCVYLPKVVDIYPDGVRADIKAGDAARGLESDFRPHFFDGVCSVVQRLFAIVKPDIAVFGEKDYQQLQVIREMVLDHAMAIEVIGAPIVRDEFGLALSSRNAYLDIKALEIARRMNVILQSDTPTHNALLNAGFDKVDYIETRWGRILAAAWIGKTRLIDNIVSTNH